MIRYNARQIRQTIWAKTRKKKWNENFWMKAEWILIISIAVVPVLYFRKWKICVGMGKGIDLYWSIKLNYKAHWYSIKLPWKLICILKTFNHLLVWNWNVLIPYTATCWFWPKNYTPDKQGAIGVRKLRIWEEATPNDSVLGTEGERKKSMW